MMICIVPTSPRSQRLCSSPPFFKPRPQNQPATHIYRDPEDTQIVLIDRRQRWRSTPPQETFTHSTSRPISGWPKETSVSKRPTQVSAEWPLRFLPIVPVPCKAVVEPGRCETGTIFPKEFIGNDKCCSLILARQSQVLMCAADTTRWTAHTVFHRLACLVAIFPFWSSVRPDTLFYLLLPPTR